MVAKFVTNDRARVGDKGSDDILFQAEGEVEVRPSFISIFEHRHAKDKVMDVFDIAVAFTFVGQAQNNAGNLDIGECHVVGGARQHLAEIVRGGLIFVVAVASGGCCGAIGTLEEAFAMRSWG